MAYHAYAEVGAVRSIGSQADKTAVLMRVDGREENGVANRMSVLTITAQPSAMAPLTVVCSNGTRDEMEEKRFLRRVAGTSLQSA